MAPASLRAQPGDSHAEDFTRVLPFQLSMSILGLLDQKSLDACGAVSGRWELLVRQLREELQCRSSVQRSLLQLQELCPRKTIPNYAKRVEVQIPQLDDEGEVIEVKEKEQKKRRKSKTEDFSLHEAYRELKTDKVELEERNVFCGPYKTRVLLEQSDSKRRTHCSGGACVAAAHRRVRLLGEPPGQEVPLLLPGPCRALCLRQDKGLLLSTSSCDLSIRCWDIHSGACLRTFSGHYSPVSCLHSHQERFVSGAGDGLVKVWSLKSGKCLRTLVHGSPVWAVRMDGSHVVSGGHRGLLKVWSAETGALIKTLERHQGPVLCLSFDQWHLVTGSSDGYALGWSMLGKFRRCLMAFFHPKEVLSLEFLYLRVISACADGHVRIFSFLSGACLRVLQPGGSAEPVSALHVAGNRVVTNSPSRVLLLQFQPVLWDYSLPADRELKKEMKPQKGKRQGTSAEQQQRAQDKAPRPRQPPKSQGKPQGDEAEQSPAPPAPEEAEAAVQYQLPQADPSRAMSPDKFLLTISTLQGSCRAAPASPSPELAAEAREAQQQQQQQRPGKLSLSRTPLQQQQQQQAAQLQRARLHSHSLAMTRVSTPFETKVLRLRLQNSLHSPAVKSSIPAPCVVRPRFCGWLGERKTPGGHGKDAPGPKDGGQPINPCTIAAALGLAPAAPGTAAGRNEAAGRIKPPCPSSPRRDSGLRLLTAEQQLQQLQEMQEAALAAQHQAQQAKPTEGKERARRKAWLRKVRGLPVDSFTGERKTPAPELGHNTFI